MVLLRVTWDLEPYSRWKFLRARVSEIVLQNQQAPGDGEGQGSLACYIVHGFAKSWIRLSVFTFTFHFHALEKEMATHSSVLAWRIPGMGEPGGLPLMGLHRVRHD